MLGLKLGSPDGRIPTKGMLSFLKSPQSKQRTCYQERHDDVIKWSIFCVTGPLSGESTGQIFVSNLASCQCHWRLEWYIVTLYDIYATWKQQSKMLVQVESHKWRPTLCPHGRHLWVSCRLDCFTISLRIPNDRQLPIARAAQCSA